MARRKRNNGRKAFMKQLLEIVQKVAPHEILAVMAKEYDSYIKKSGTAAEQEFWIKCARATANLSSGMDKWVTEWADEEEEE